MNLYNILYYYQRSKVFGWFFRPSEAYKTLCPALNIIMLSCCLPLQFQHIDTSGRQQERMTIPEAANIVLEAPDDGWKNRTKHIER